MQDITFTLSLILFVMKCFTMPYALHIRMHTIILKHFISYYMTFLIKLWKHIERNVYLSNNFSVLLGSFVINNQFQVMAPMITSNCITKIHSGEVVQNPILQILDFSLTSEDRHFVHLSDATSTIQNLFGSTLNSLFTSSQVEIGSLVEINKFNHKSIQNTKCDLNLPLVGTTCTHITSILHYPLFHNKLSANYKFMVYVSQDSYSPWSTSEGFNINHYW